MSLNDNLSYWEQSAYFKNIDLLIVGSGLVGICTAISYQKMHPQANILVVERSFLPSGASTKNAGFACFGSVSELVKDLIQYSENEVFSLVEKRYLGLQKLRTLLGDTAIGYENTGGYEIFLPEKINNQRAKPIAATFEQYVDKIEYLNQQIKSIIGPNTYAIKTDQIQTFGMHSGSQLIFNQYEGLVNSGLMMKNLIAYARSLGIEILNGIELKSVENQPNGMIARTKNDFEIKAANAIICTNAFAQSLLPNLHLKPGRGQVLVTQPIPNLPFAGGFHLDEGYFYFRKIDDRILLGGGRNLDFAAEETTQFGLTATVQEELELLLKEVIIPNTPFAIEQRWSGIMAFGDHQKPIVTQLASHVYCAVKCQGMGVALGANMADEVVDLVG